MKKAIFAVLSVCLTAVLAFCFVACTGEGAAEGAATRPGTSADASGGTGTATGAEASAATGISTAEVVATTDVAATTGAEDEPGEGSTVGMTESYARGRESFHTVTGFTLPELAGRELLASSDLRPGQHAAARFAFSGTADDFAATVAALREEIGRDPATSDQYGAAWEITVEFDGALYIGRIGVTSEPDGAGGATVRVDYAVSEVLSSYRIAREGFLSATGVQLPLLPLIAADATPYTEGTKSYRISLSGGDGLGGGTVETLRAFFSSLDGWTYDSFARDGETDKYFYTSAEGDVIGVEWRREYEGMGKTVAVYVSATLR